MSTMATRPSGGFVGIERSSGVVGAAIDVGDEIRAEDDQRHGDERRGQAAEQHEAPALGASDRGVVRGRLRHRIVISTRRLRGSSVLSGVRCRGSASPCDSTSTSEASSPALRSSARTACARSSPSL